MTQHKYSRIPRSYIAADVNKMVDSSEDSVEFSDSDSDGGVVRAKVKQILKDRAKSKENRFSKGFITPPNVRGTYLQNERPYRITGSLPPMLPARTSSRVPTPTTQRRNSQRPQPRIIDLSRKSPTTFRSSTQSARTTLSNCELLQAYDVFNGDAQSIVNHLCSEHPEIHPRVIDDDVCQTFDSRINDNL